MKDGQLQVYGSQPDPSPNLARCGHDEAGGQLLLEFMRRHATHGGLGERREGGRLGIDEELVARLEAAMPAGPQRARNIRMVLHFYGFGGGAWPTLEETAAAFGVGTRERVRQIVGEALTQLTGAGRLPALRAASRLIRSRPFWTDRELAASLAERTGTSADICVRSFLSLLHDLGLARGYEAYDHNLERLTRSQLTANKVFFLVRKDMLVPLQWGLIAARRLSSRLGLVCATRLAVALGPEAPLEPLKMLLITDPACCTWSQGEAFWCARETPDNVLVALTAKAFAAAREVTPSRLADALANALNARAGRERHAGHAEIAAWISRSRWFRRSDGRLAFLGEPGELTPVERVLVDYLAVQGEADYPAIKAHMSSRGMQASMIAKTATQSPVIHIDRTGGMRSYRYSLIGDGFTEECADGAVIPPSLH